MRHSDHLVRKITFSAMFLAIGLVLPFLTGQIPQIGAMLSPMHIPVLLCGFACGGPWGMAVGFILPLLRNLLFSMPPMPGAISMAFEMAAYGAFSGLFYQILPRTKWAIYASQVAAMVLGRLVWGCAQFVVLGINGTQFSLAMFWAGAVANAIPGIILHLALVPVLVMAMERAGLTIRGPMPEPVAKKAAV